MTTEPTTRQKLLEAMLALGCCEIHSSRVWQVFSHDQEPGKCFFLGKGTALRAGRTVNDSTPAYTEKARLLAAWAQFNATPAIINLEAS